MREFISEDAANTFEGYLKFQAIDIATTSPEDLQMWRGIFEESRARAFATPKVGVMKLKPLVSGEHRYAVAIRKESGLWLTLWVRYSSKSGFFVMMPRGDGEWDPHASYHIDGALHHKSHDRIMGDQMKRQRLTDAFKGVEYIGEFAGYGPETVGAICEPTAFSGIVEVAPGTLGPRDGSVAVALVEPNPNYDPGTLHGKNKKMVQQEIFRDTIPWIMIEVYSSSKA